MKVPPSTIEIDPEMVGEFPRGSSVLEIACAHGRTAFFIEDQGFDVTAIDIDPQAIEQARIIGKKRGSHVEFIEADARFMPFDDATFDVVVMNGFLTMMVDKDSRIRAILEAFRVMKEGGGIYIADFLQTWDSPIYNERYEAHEKITGEKGTFIVTEDGSIDGEEIYKAHHHTEEEIKGLLGSRFEIIQEGKEEFTSYHGNKVNGIKILALKK